MGQVSVYFPEDVERSLRARAKESGKSLSSYLTELARRDSRETRGWPESFRAALGAWEGDFPVPEDPPPEEPEAL